VFYERLQEYVSDDVVYGGVINQRMDQMQVWKNSMPNQSIS